MNIYIFSILFLKVLIDEKCTASDVMPPKAPENYNLIYASLLTSTGATAPMKRFLNSGESGVWQCDSPESSSVRIESAPINNPRRIHHLIDARVSDFPPNCREGDLTIEGMDQMHELGQKYAQYFIQTNNLLQNYLIPNDLYLISSYDDSSYRSLLSFLDGLYPPQYQEEFLNILTGSESGDVLRPDSDYCADIQKSYKNYTDGSFKALLSEANQTLSELFTYLDIDFDGIDPETLLFACDYVRAFTCSNRSLPQEISDLYSVCQEYAQNILTQQYGKYGGSYTFREILMQFDRFFSGITPVKLSISSGLPTTMVEILKLLGQNDIKIPLYRAHLLFEFFKKDVDVYVRVLYNGELLKIPDLPLYDNQFYDLSSFYTYGKSLVHSQQVICKEMP